MNISPSPSDERPVRMLAGNPAAAGAAAAPPAVVPRFLGHASGALR